MAGAGRDLHAHFLDACSLCRRPLGDNRDIYMYRGDIAFCSEECRSLQIDAEEAAKVAAERARAKKRPMTHGPSTATEVDGPQDRSKVRAGSVLAL